MSIDLVVEPDEAVGMARQLQVEFAGACYHVIARGNRRVLLVYTVRELVYTVRELVYTVREWSGLTVKNLGRCLHRDPSMTSRLYARYVTKRNVALEKCVQTILMRQFNTHA
ncbi:MAG: hypothetical protein IH977_12960 [Nitrospinae bacterium]|nr:hypothetical protein [Nitrospinota bacterium]